jgi:opacity protein-like surface antigen
VYGSIASKSSSQQTISAGLRWDFAEGFALKAQYDYVDLDANSGGRLANHQPNFQPGTNLNVFAIGVDYVF